VRYGALRRVTLMRYCVSRWRVTTVCYGALRRYVTVRFADALRRALRCVTAVHYSALRLCVAVCYGALRRYVTVRYGALRYVTLRYGALR